MFTVSTVSPYADDISLDVSDISIKSNKFFEMDERKKLTINIKKTHYIDLHYAKKFKMYTNVYQRRKYCFRYC